MAHKMPRTIISVLLRAWTSVALLHEQAGDQSCDLNISTVTMPVVKPGDLFPNSTTPPLSAFEMRTKLKSREAIWEAAGLGKQDSKKTDGNLTMCMAINQLAYNWVRLAPLAARVSFLVFWSPTAKGFDVSGDSATLAAESDCIAMRCFRLEPAGARACRRVGAGPVPEGWAANGDGRGQGCQDRDPRYGNFDIILVHFPRVSQLYPHPIRAVGYDLLSTHAGYVLIGACHPMLCPNWGSRPGVDPGRARLHQGRRWTVGPNRSSVVAVCGGQHQPGQRSVVLPGRHALSVFWLAIPLWRSPIGMPLPVGCTHHAVLNLRLESHRELFFPFFPSAARSPIFSNL